MSAPDPSPVPSARELLLMIDGDFPGNAPEILAARVEAVLAIHVEQAEDGASFCSYCFNEDGQPMYWPCATVRALNGEKP